MIVVLIGWIGALIYTHDLFKNPEGIPNTKLRLKTYEILLKLLAWSFGFVVTLTGEISECVFSEYSTSSVSKWSDICMAHTD